MHLLALASASLATLAAATPVRFESQGTFAPNPSIAPATGLTTSVDACVQFGSCTTNANPAAVTLTYPSPIGSIPNRPTTVVVAPTDPAQSSSYQASLAAAGASSVFSALSSSRDAAAASSSSSASASASASTSAPGNATGAARHAFGTGMGPHGVAAAAGLVAFGAVLLAA